MGAAEFDWSPVLEAIERRAWLLEEPRAFRVGYDEVQHTTICNLHPDYQQGKDREEVLQLRKRGCDCGALKEAKKRRGLE